MNQIPTQVGVDISTLEAIQSLFRSSADPWALECLSNWIDVTVNHDETLYALPKALGELDQKVVFPDLLRRAERLGIIRPVDDESAADRIKLSAKEIERLYIVFEAWARANLELLRQWLDFTTSVRRIVAGRFIDAGPLNLWVRDQFWQRRPAGWLRDERDRHRISPDFQLLAFDMIVRAAQYHLAFGESRAYQPHPLRSLYVPGTQTPPAAHSWGWLLIGQIAGSRKKWDSERLLATVAEIRGRVQGAQATTTDLLSDSPEVRRQKLNSIAVKLGADILPSGYHKAIDLITKLIGLPLELISEAHGIPFVGVAWEIVQIPLVKGTSRAVQRIKFVQRRVEFPSGSSQRPSLSMVKDKLGR